MSDILKVRAPLVDKNNIPTHKPASDPTVPFKLGDVPVVPKTAAQGELLKQGTTLINKEAGSSVLAGLLRDPAVTVRYLTSIFMMEEIVGLLPLNNSPETKGMENILSAMMIAPYDIPAEMKNQENCSTDFKGALFDFLREIIQKSGDFESSAVVSRFLKSLNFAVTRNQTITSIANNINCLKEAMSPSDEISRGLMKLADDFLINGDKNFDLFCARLSTLIKQAENSILYTPKTEKLISIINYNLSRFQNSTRFLKDSFLQLLNTLKEDSDKLFFAKSTVLYLLSKAGDEASPGKEYILKNLVGLLPGGTPQLTMLIKDDKEAIEHYKSAPSFLKDENLEETLLLLSDDKEIKNASQKSRVMENLSLILEDSGKTLKTLSPDRLNKIYQSLLSSPSNFTPLLHYIIPVEQHAHNAFAEFWINPNDVDEDEGTEKVKTGIHMLINFEIKDLGRFEGEIWCQNKKLNFSLFCPYDCTEQFKAIAEPVKKAAASLGYSFDSITVDDLIKPRTLIEVFKTLPNKRSGLNVKI